VLYDADSTAFAAARQQAATRRIPIVEEGMRNARGPRSWPWAFVVNAATVARSLGGSLGEDLAQLRREATPIIRPILRFAVWARPRVDTAGPRQTAPAVVGVLAGTDSVLSKQYVVITAHMDAGGIRPGRPDSIDNGADDNASGTAALLALAKAFSQPGARPRRSLIFMATSGGAAGRAAWASNTYFERNYGGRYRFGISGALNVDMIGRLRGGDTVVVDGIPDVDLAQHPAWLAAAHPELKLVVEDGGTAMRPTSDHFAFVRADVPSLFIHAGNHPDLPSDVGPDAIPSPPPSSSRDTTIVADDAARIAQFVFYLGEMITNADRTPRWNSTGRRRYSEAVAP